MLIFFSLCVCVCYYVCYIYTIHGGITEFHSLRFFLCILSFVCLNYKISIFVEISFFCILQFTPQWSLKCVGVSVLQTTNIIWCLSYFILYPEKLRCPFPYCPWITAAFAFCHWMDCEKLLFLQQMQPVVLLLTDFSSRPVGWVSQLATGKCQLTMRRDSAEQTTFGHSRQWTIWKWLCSFLCVNPSCEWFLKMAVNGS